MKSTLQAHCHFITDEVIESELSDGRWRDENLDSLPQWHPCFFEIYPEFTELIALYKVAMERYKDILLTTCSEDRGDLYNHVNEEAVLWLFDRFDGVTKDIWEEA